MPDFSKLNYINVGPHGTFADSGTLKTEPQDINAIFEHLKAEDAKKLTIYFHGGLVKEQAGHAIAEKMWTLFKDDAHPVTFVWETGLIETLKNNLIQLYQTKLFQKAVKYAIRHVAKRLGGGIGAKGPGQAMSLNEIEAELQAATCFDQFDMGARGGAAQLDEADLDGMQDEIEAELEEDLEADDEVEEILEEEAPKTKLLNPDVIEEIDSDDAKGIISTVTLVKRLAKIVYRVLRRFIRKRDHGFYPTVVEETLRELYLADAGAWVWGGMKEVAEAMWQPNAGPLDKESHVGTYFLEKLAAYQKVDPEFVVDLVGHSAGSIATCHLLNVMADRHPDLKIRNVLFLAPACTSDLFYEQVVTEPGRYEYFRMYTMHEDLETKDRLVPLVYTRSLLYFISGVLEDEADKTIAGLESQLRGDAPYDGDPLNTVHTFLYEAGQNRLVLSDTVDADPGLNSASHAHGDFDDDPATQESIRIVIAS